MDNPTKYSRPYPKAVVDAMEHIVGLPSGPKRWRAAAATWVNLNQVQESGFTAKQEYLATAEMVTKKRDTVSRVNKFAELKTTDTARDSGVREALEMPAGLWGYIKMFDRLAFDKSNPDAKRNLKKLRAEFPEFCVTEAF
jgi:hypothetical protein